MATEFKENTQLTINKLVLNVKKLITKEIKKKQFFN